jgi:hypothetical protein
MIDFTSFVQQRGEEAGERQGGRGHNESRIVPRIR